jgi:hypothetical protein
MSLFESPLVCHPDLIEDVIHLLLEFAERPLVRRLEPFIHGPAPISLRLVQVWRISRQEKSTTLYSSIFQAVIETTPSDALERYPTLTQSTDPHTGANYQRTT